MQKTIAPVQNLEPGLSSAGKDNPQLHTLGNDRFFICPHCGAKNRINRVRLDFLRVLALGGAVYLVKVELPANYC